MSKRFFETNKGIRGGMLKGKAHYDSEGNSLGGIKAVVTDQGGTPVELEGNEVIINKKTVQSDKVLTVKGTPKEILSTLNQMDGNGVAIGDEDAEILDKYKTGGELIKRADGSYSRRGLWDNIRDNVGSGRKPTKQMLEQEAKIKSKYHLGGDMSKHLAPNGKASNLTHEQWHLVRSPEFKAWFGDWENEPANSSEVVDENGEPKIMYHGSRGDFNIFSNENENKLPWTEGGLGFYFTSNYNSALGYGRRVISTFINSRAIKKSNETEHAFVNENNLYKLRKSGFDAIYFDGEFTNTRGQRSFKDDELVVFNPNQIKLADGSNTTFDANNDDIRYAEGGEIPSLIEKGVVDLKFHETTPEHAEIYGLTAEKPLYIQTLYVNDNKRLQGIGTKVLHYIYSIAKQNGNDVIFGHINQKASFTKDEKETTFNHIDMVKNWLHKNGYAINEDNNDFHKVVKFKTGGSIGDMTPSELKEFYASPEGKKLDAETYAEWKSLVNMSKAEITNFYNSPEGKQAGLSESEATKHGIDSGRESAEWIMKMKDIPYKDWTSNMWRWAKKQISFIKRMSGMKGDLYDDKGRKTRKHTALLIWGHNPEKKFEGGGSIEKEEEMEKEMFMSGGIGTQLSIEGSEPEYSNSLFSNEKTNVFARGGAVGENQLAYAKRIVNNWDEVPTSWKNTTKINKVEYSIDPKDKGLNTILSKIVGSDELRPVMSGINFDENGVTVTDAHKLLTIAAKTDIRGIYPTLKSIEKKSSYINSAGLIDGNYPNYERIIPKDFKYSYEVDLYKIIQYSKVADNFSNKTTHQASFKVNDELNIGFNVRFLSQICTSMIQLGFDKCYFHFNGERNSVIISNDKTPIVGNSTIGLIMPVVLNFNGRVDNLGAADIDFGTVIKCYFDFSKNQIINNDNSIVDFKMNYGEDDVFTPSIVKLLDFPKQKDIKLPILENLVVKNNVAKRTDLENTIEIKGIDVPDGFYFIDNGSVMQSSRSAEDIDEYPKEKVLENKISFTANREYLLWAFDKLNEFTGSDDLRPVMMAINLLSQNGTVSLTSTDANLLTTIDSSEYININYEEKINLNINPVVLIPMLKSINDEEITISIDSKIDKEGYTEASLIIFESKKINLVSRLIDGRYPNFKAVIPYENPNVLSMNMKDVRGIFSSKEFSSFISKNKKDAELISISAKEDTDGLNISILARKREEIIDNKFLTKIAYKKSENTTNGNTASLIMPIKPSVSEFDSLFIFNAKLFEKFVKELDGDVLEFGYSEISKAYIVGDKNIFYSESKIKPKSVKPEAKKEVEIVPTANKTLLQSAIDKDKNWGERIYKSNSLKELNELIEYLGKTHYLEELRDATSRRNYVQRHELDKGTEHEKEHLETLEKVAEHKITPEEAVVETAKTHIAENPEYYEDLAKMEAENEESIPDLIEGLKVLAESLEGAEKKEIEDVIEGLELLLDDEEPIESFKDKKNDVLYTVEKDEKGKWTVFSVSPKWERRNEYPSAFTSKEDAIMIAKLEAGITKEVDPEEKFMRNQDNKFEKGGELRMATGGKIVFKPITTPL